jgi:hypothetical protein
MPQYYWSGLLEQTKYAFDGNTNDDTTHRQTWDVLVAIAGRQDFLYVADSKLCTGPNLEEPGGGPQVRPPNRWNLPVDHQ